MKYLPNALTLLRIAGSAALLLFPPMSLWFLVIYGVCGLTDVLDGYIARRTGNVTGLGAALDTAADFAFLLAAVIAFLPILQIPMWLWLWAAGILLVRLTSATVGWVKFRAPAFLHTVANKVTGLALFFFPLLYAFFGLGYTGALLCGLATVSSAEELLIVLRSDELDTDTAGLFWK